MMVLEPEIDPNLCRLCGKADGLKVDIFDEKHNYQKKIHSLLPVAIYEYDPLPKKMCHRCMFQVDGFYEFRENCLKTEQYLKLQLPWMPRKASNGSTDDSTLNKEPMVHISSPTLNAFTMDQWFVARNMIEADDDDVQIVDVFCRPRQSNDRTASSDQPEERQLDANGSRPTSKINDGKAGTPDCEQNMPAEPKTLLAIKSRIEKRQKKSKMQQPKDLSATDAVAQENTANSSSDCTMAVNTLAEKSTTQSVITKVVNETENSLSNNSINEQQHVQEQHQNVPVYTVYDEQENEVPCIVKQNGKLLNKEDQGKCKLVVKNYKEQEQHQKAEEQRGEQAQQQKLKGGQEQSALLTQAQKPLECDVEDRTVYTDALHTTSVSEDTAYLSERGIAHVRKQMKEQQKKSLQVSIGPRRTSASREGCPSGCRRRRPGAQQADMSGSAATKLSKINRKHGGSFFISQEKDTNYANKPDEGERRVLAPKNVLKITIPKNRLTDGASDASEDVCNNICNSQENRDSDNGNVNRNSKEFHKSSELTSEPLEENKTMEERPGIIVTRIPAACDIYTCEACERMFVTRETAYSHMCDEGGESNSSETETGGEIRLKAGTSAGDSERYSCCVCGQRFSRNATLVAHLKAHTKVWSESDDSDGTGILRDISTDSDDTEIRGKGNRRRRRGSRKSSTCPRKSVKLSLPVVV
ncbi:uncharacterized protein LOC126458359 [Schistocerca serialis cubense]|uniref:uncharacterized protein LOC126458359 n=1 Tax=Schistocerca serialis cubense TaxID=2023355 RepID=UPI00214E3F18|nr:uncharacterized protein LOC126458359 [Schistocerca serialis cubense]